MSTVRAITKQKLKDLYETMTNKELCEFLDMTQPTLLSYIKKAGIELKGKGNRKLSKLTIKG